ncbi:MAG: Tat pathway signal sequence domain protein [Gammaproteobacteria bacterium]|nr:Tat pathway signal sequence domain protein [Gammaproteobacteria bacterium]
MKIDYQPFGRVRNRTGPRGVAREAGRVCRRFLAVLIPLATAPTLALGQDLSGLTVELNKLEEAENACRAYLVFENRSESAFSSLKLDLVMFGADGIITRRLAVEGGPLPAGKTSVKLFEISGLACSGISRILLNDVISCRDDSGEHDDCVERVTTSSRNEVSFFK